MHGEILATWRDPVTDTLVTKSVQERHVRWDADRARRFREDRHISSTVSFMNATNGMLLRVRTTRNTNNDVIVWLPTCWEASGANEVYDLLYPEQT